MKPNEKGWLAEYLNFRKELLGGLVEESKKTSHPEHSLYRVIQPTGLMYGRAVEVMDHPASKDWDERDRMKILLAESLISSSLLFNDKPVKNSEDLSEVMTRTLGSIANFYNNIFPELATPSKTLFGRRKPHLSLPRRF